MEDLVRLGCGKRVEPELVGKVADLGAALGSVHAAGRRGAAGQGQGSPLAFGAVGAIEKPQSGGSVLQGAAQQGPGTGGGDLPRQGQAAQDVGVSEACGVGGADQVRGRVRAERGVAARLLIGAGRGSCR